jgi:hypothetical protein
MTICRSAARLQDPDCNTLIVVQCGWRGSIEP